MGEVIAGALPAPGQLLGLAAVLCAAWLLSLLGGLVAWRGRMVEADLVCGWGIAIAVVVALGGFVSLDLSRIALGLLAASVLSGLATWIAERRIAPPGAGRLLVLALPVLVIVSAMPPSQWDEFSQWAHSILFLVTADRLPNAAQPETGASYPAYPYAMPIAGYLASRIAGSFIDNAGALFNAILLLSMAALLARLAAEAAAVGRGWGLMALALLGVTLLNPTFVPKIAFTGYADSATTVTVAFAGVLGWACLGALGDGDKRLARTLALRCGLAMMALVSLKEGNAALVAVVTAGIAAAALTDRRVRFAQALVLSPLAFGPPLLLWATWQAYVARELPGAGFQAVTPDLSLVPQVLLAMLDVATHKGGFFGLMLIILVLALRAVWRPGGPIGRMAVIAATAFIAYVGFLLWAYIFRFDPWEAARAASFWRYSTHLGGLALAVAALAMGEAWRRYGAARGLGRFAAVPVALILVAPVALEPKLRFDRHPVKQQVRSVGAEIAAILPANARLLVVDPADPGLYGKMLDFELRRAGRDGMVEAIHGMETPESSVRRVIARTGPSHIWLHSMSDGVRAGLGLSLPSGASYLLVRSGPGWTVAGRWPFEGYSDPAVVKD